MMQSEAKAQRTKPAASWGKIVGVRIVTAILLLGVAVLLGSTGLRAIESESYDFAWQSSDGSGQDNVSGSSGAVHLVGGEAIEHGVGLLASGAMLSLWSFSMLWSIAGPLALGAQWSRTHTVLTALSLAALITAVIGFFPPWQIGTWASCNGMYLALMVCFWLGMIPDRSEMPKMGQRVFPVLILFAIVLGQVWVGIMAGVICGLFVAFGLALHILLLMPNARAELWKPKGAMPAMARRS